MSNDKILTMSRNTYSLYKDLLHQKKIWSLILSSVKTDFDEDGEMILNKEYRSILSDHAQILIHKEVELFKNIYSEYPKAINKNITLTNQGRIILD